MATTIHAHPPLTPASLLLPHRRLLVGLALTFVALGTAAAISGGDLLLLWDKPIQRGVEASRTAAADDFFRTVSRFGGTFAVLSLGGLLTALTWRRCRAVAMAVLIATLSRPLIEFVVKALVDRNRPDLERMVPGNGPSFPSGHVMAAVALWGLLPVVVALYTRRRWVWWSSVVLSGALIIAISASRTYLGVHWFSDVTGGLILGTFFLLAVEWVLHRQHRRHPCTFVVEPPAKQGFAEDAAGDRESELVGV